MSKLNKEELLNALLAADITDEEIKKAREKKKNDDMARAVRADRINKKRDALIIALGDYMLALNPKAEPLNWDEFEQELKEVEKYADHASVKINVTAKDKDADFKAYDEMVKDLFKTYY